MRNAFLMIFTAAGLMFSNTALYGVGCECDPCECIDHQSESCCCDPCECFSEMPTFCKCDNCKCQTSKSAACPCTPCYCYKSDNKAGSKPILKGKKP